MKTDYEINTADAAGPILTNTMKHFGLRLTAGAALHLHKSLQVFGGRYNGEEMSKKRVNVSEAEA